MNATTTLERPGMAAIAIPAHADRMQAAQRIAADLFQQQPDWVTFFREVLGVDGLVRKLFPSPEALAAFEQTDEHAHILQLLVRLRERGAQAALERERTRVITVRLPKSLHESLLVEAHHRHTSMNQLCISKLLQPITSEMTSDQ